jgi:hypothetical protein
VNGHDSNKGKAIPAIIEIRNSQYFIIDALRITYKTSKAENDNLFVTIDELQIIKNPRKSQENS